mmetsp:Transcript_7483/g.45969  ORF Transcript_7483/g.45969 Transcript_7483/m.45969 type:complete len:112 (-) Transcript_7483:984-1319(-)
MCPVRWQVGWEEKGRARTCPSKSMGESIDTRRMDRKEVCCDCSSTERTTMTCWSDNESFSIHFYTEKHEGKESADGESKRRRGRKSKPWNETESSMGRGPSMVRTPDVLPA